VGSIPISEIGRQNFEDQPTRHARKQRSHPLTKTGGTESALIGADLFGHRNDGDDFNEHRWQAHAGHAPLK
jgi:hypothetical protein